MNDERIELPDIDIDLAPSKKNIIMNWIKDERGKNFYPNIDNIFRENLGCTMVATFGTETSKSAVQTACRGYRSDNFPDGIDVDTAQYLSSLIPVERGFVWDLNTVFYGDEEKDRKPITAFINEVNQYPGLKEILLGIEGNISRRGSHASGVIFFDEDPFEFCCFMKTPNGDIITQYDLHDAEWCGLTKYDFLVTEVQDKIAKTIELLQEDNQLEKDLSLREIYDKYFHPNVIDIEDDKVWNNIQNANIIDLFQFDSDVGSQAAKKIKPRSMMELSDANGLMRLMTAEKGAETPMEKYIRFKNDISLWYKEMDDYKLTKEEQEYLKPHFLKSHGVPPSQEQLMTMLMDEHLCGFSLKDANNARKIVGKKQMNKIPMLHEQICNQAKSPALAKYIWECGVGPQMGYAFSYIHALAYSFIGYQTAYLATHWNPVYWNTACLIVNSGSLEDNSEETIVDIYAPENDDIEEGVTFKDLPDRSGKIKKTASANYEKIAKAIGIMKSKNIKVSLININTSDYSFKPDAKNNRILYGLKALSGINEDIINLIKEHRPYTGIKDFMERVQLPKIPMINLIKAGAFDEIDEGFNHDRIKIMTYYLYRVSEPKTKLTLQNFNGLMANNLVPDDLNFEKTVYNFNKYLKANKKSDYYMLDDKALSFFSNYYSDYLDSVEIVGGIGYISQKIWDKLYKTTMDKVRDWLKDNQKEVLNNYNFLLFKELWDKYAFGNISKWEMDSLCFYYNDHELKNVNHYKYGFSDFNKLPVEPEVDKYFKKGNVNIPIFKLTRIIGTVLAKNDTKNSIILLTTTGVVNVKFTRDYYAMFKKQISQIQADGSKKVIEKSWFKRGNKLMITGFRRDDTFVAKTYANTESHQLYIIDEIIGDSIKIRHERYTSNGCLEEEDYD